MKTQHHLEKGHGATEHINLLETSVNCVHSVQRSQAQLLGPLFSKGPRHSTQGTI